MEHVSDRDSDIVFLKQKHGCNLDNNAATAEIKTYGYELLHNRRKDREKVRGGGVGVLVKNSLLAKQLPVKHYTSFELTLYVIT